MQLFNWNDKLKTGMAEIDRQHQELIKRINAFIKACMEEPRNFAAMASTFDFLNAYVVEHFALEERLMLEHKYPRIDLHIQDHREMRYWVDKTSQSISRHEFPEKLVMEVNYRLVEWLQLHIRNRDRNMSKFFQEIAGKNKISSLLALIRGDQ